MFSMLPVDRLSSRTTFHSFPGALGEMRANESSTTRDEISHAASL